MLGDSVCSGAIDWSIIGSQSRGENVRVPDVTEWSERSDEIGGNGTSKGVHDDSELGAEFGDSFTT